MHRVLSLAPLVAPFVALFALLFAICAPASAQPLHIPEAQTFDATLPMRGTTMTQVESRFGAPQRRHETVGGGHPRQPPITRWDYDGFYVVFENRHVINAVRPDEPTLPRRTDGLTIDSHATRLAP